MWEDIFVEEKTDIDFKRQTEVTVSSVQYPRITAEMDLAEIGGQWYLHLGVDDVVWTDSNEFIGILIKNGIID